MPIFDRLRHGVDLTKFKADQLLRINRVQGEIDGLHQNVAQIQKKIAMKAIDLHMAGALTNLELETLCRDIDSIYYQIRNKETEIANIRSEDVPKYIPSPTVSKVMNPCPTCGFDIPLSAEFCPNCGYASSKVVQSIPVESVPTTLCPICGNLVASSVAFCPECGHKMVEVDQPGPGEGDSNGMPEL